jgi:CO/xanthine dehydrogenase FAD-binding subunit
VSRSLVVSTTLHDALSALSNGARPVAGGTDLVVGARQGKKPLPDAIVAIHRLTELRSISELTDGGGLQLGALTTHGEIVASRDISQRFTALADASSIVGSHATRANGTIGGNVMTASPAMDTGGPLVCLGAVAILQSLRGTRTVALDGFFLNPGRTLAEPDELLVAIEIPNPSPNNEATGSCYVRLEYRRQMEIAIVGATALVRIHNGNIVHARVAITALAPTIHRVAAAEEALENSKGDANAMDLAATSASLAAAPISDVRASSDYRTAMAKVIARRAIHGAIERAKGNHIAIPATASLGGTQ